MDVVSVAFLICATVFLGGVLIGGTVTLIQVRAGRRERFQMKQHLRRLEVTGRD